MRRKGTVEQRRAVKERKKGKEANVLKAERRREVEETYCWKGLKEWEGD